MEMHTYSQKNILTLSFSSFTLGEICFLVAGIGTLVALPFFSNFGFIVWALVKAFYVIGVLLFMIKK